VPRGTAEQIPVPDDSLDAVMVGSAWHWFDAPAALAEIARVLRGGGRLGVLASSADTEVGWVRDLYTEGDLGRWSRPMAVADVVPWFRTHSYYLNADDATRTAVEDRAARVVGEVFPGGRSIEFPAMTLCWRAERLPR
jgi:ubiquinone/menaquinone biosynthesis C-methylase UbiE